MTLPKMIVLDLDGTLLDSNKNVSGRTVKLLTELKEKGVQLVFATARPPRVTVFKGIDLTTLGTLIFYNGALFDCALTKKQIHFGIPHRTAQKVIDYCNELDPEANLSVEIKDHWFSFKPLDYREFMHVDHNPVVIEQEHVSSQDCTKILLTDFPFANQLVTTYQNELNVIVTDQGRLTQIMAKEASKEQAIAHLLKTHQLDFDDVLCFGDDYNDLGLFQACGYAVAMGNAVDELKEIADEVTSSNDEEGVANVLEKLKNRE
ncbi:Cof subfamily protein (haloacid dehalogenase superfamily) [Natronobacillus azotifigens]|uniref:HAD family hydrolase n=1 Tax=Natronobacillus azotifigens TaxID=472978 RepID=A0A9J6REI2_9BACI|nr:HAD family hydrolase [Natronobacillus azotifigens]MCZ0703869.1 HAD family hydrolase [Natronobacillus azotifigens]